MRIKIFIIAFDQSSQIYCQIKENLLLVLFLQSEYKFLVQNILDLHNLVMFHFVSGFTPRAQAAAV